MLIWEYVMIRRSFYGYFLVFWAILFPIPSSLFGADKQPKALPQYLIYPITTELHKRLIGQPANFFAVVDTTAAIGSDGIDASGLPFKPFQQDLAKLRKPGNQLQNAAHLLTSYRLNQ